MSKPYSSHRHTRAAEYDHLVKLILVGDEGTGKTSLMRRFCDDEFMFSYMATIGVDFKIRTLDLSVDGVPTKVKLQMWDTAGQERFNSITKSFYRGADIMVVVYDVTSHHTFAHVRKWIAGCTEVCGSSIPMCLVGNKCDLAQHRQVETEAGRELAGRMGSEGNPAVFVETSAKEGSGVDEIFEQMALEFVRRERAAASAGGSGPSRAGAWGCGTSRATGGGGGAVNLENDASPGCLEFFRKIFAVFSRSKTPSSTSPSGTSVDATATTTTSSSSNSRRTNAFSVNSNPQSTNVGRSSNRLAAIIPPL